ncbi:hypothetical protein ABQE95_13665, partial [Xanthomonas campestris pv. campestris]
SVAWITPQHEAGSVAYLWCVVQSFPRCITDSLAGQRQPLATWVAGALPTDACALPASVSIDDLRRLFADPACSSCAIARACGCRTRPAKPLQRSISNELFAESRPRN